MFSAPTTATQSLKRRQCLSNFSAPLCSLASKRLGQSSGMTLRQYLERRQRFHQVANDLVRSFSDANDDWLPSLGCGNGSTSLRSWHADDLSADSLWDAVRWTISPPRQVLVISIKNSHNDKLFVDALALLRHGFYHCRDFFHAR